MKDYLTRLIVFLICICSAGYTSGQAKIGGAGSSRTPHTAAMLDVESSNRGFLPPRLSLNAASMQLNGENPVDGTLVYNTNTSAPGLLGIGLYIWHSGKWNKVLDSSVQTADLADGAVTTDKIAAGSANQVLTTNPSGSGVQWTNGLSNRLSVNSNTTLTDVNIPVGGSLILVFSTACTVTAPGTASFSPVVSTAKTITSTAGTYFLTRNSTATIDIVASPLLSSVSMAEVGSYRFSAASNLNGYLLCDGSAVSRTTYAALYGIIGTSFGTGNGSTTFNIPDFRGRAFGGIGTGSGLTARALGNYAGKESHQLLVSQIPSHYHLIRNTTDGPINGGNYQSFMYNDYENNIVPNKGLTNQVGSNSAHNIMQPTLFGGDMFIKY